MQKLFRALIVDDERYARKEMITLLAKHDNIEVVGEAASINDTVKLIETRKPDLVFLDIQLVGENGFDLFDKINAGFKTIFVTAYDNYAIRAFEVNAFDYLLKPVNPKRLAQTINNLTEPVNETNLTEKVKLLYDDRIYLTLKNSSKFLELKNISAIYAENEYSRILIKDGSSVLVYKSLKKWEEKLPENHFQRIHRSSIININYVNNIKKLPNNTFQVFLSNIETPLEMSRRFAAKIKSEFNHIFNH